MSVVLSKQLDFIFFDAVLNHTRFAQTPFFINMAEPTEAQKSLLAYNIYNSRVAAGIAGTHLSDWFKAREALVEQAAHAPAVINPDANFPLTLFSDLANKCHGFPCKENFGDEPPCNGPNHPHDWNRNHILRFPVPLKHPKKQTPKGAVALCGVEHMQFVEAYFPDEYQAFVDNADGVDDYQNCSVDFKAFVAMALTFRNYQYNGTTIGYLHGRNFPTAFLFRKRLANGQLSSTGMTIYSQPAALNSPAQKQAYGYEHPLAQAVDYGVPLGGRTLNLAWIKVTPRLTPRESIFVSFMARNIARKMEAVAVLQRRSDFSALHVIVCCYNRMKHSHCHEHAYEHIFNTLLVLIAVVAEASISHLRAADDDQRHQAETALANFPLGHRLRSMGGNIPLMWDQWVLVPFHHRHFEFDHDIRAPLPASAQAAVTRRQPGFRKATLHTRYLNWVGFRFWFDKNAKNMAKEIVQMIVTSAQKPHLP